MRVAPPQSVNGLRGAFFLPAEGGLLDCGIPAPDDAAPAFVSCGRSAPARLGGVLLGAAGMLLCSLGQQLSHSPLHSLCFGSDRVGKYFKWCGRNVNVLACPSELVLTELGVNNLLINVVSARTGAPTSL